MRRSLLIAVPILALTAVLAYGAMWWRQQQETTRLIADIAGRIPISADASHSERLAALRTFINRHSQHKMDDEFYAIWRDRRAMVRALHDTVFGARSDPVHAECAMRTMFVQMILDHWGYKHRTVWVYAPSQDFNSHTFLDILNPDTGRWESHDPAYDVVWRDAATGAPVSIAEAGGDLEAITPCDAAGCGYHLHSRENFSIKDRAYGYFEIISVADRDNDQRFTVFTPRADMSRTFKQKSRHGTYCEVLAKNCEDGLFAIAADGPHRRHGPLIQTHN